MDSRFSGNDDSLVRLCFIGSLFLTGLSSPLCAQLANPGFEDGLTVWEKNGWNLQSQHARFDIDETERHDARRAARIMSLLPDDTHLDQMVSVEPDTVYRVSGWIKTQEVKCAEGDIGASLAIPETWIRSENLKGNQDWQACQFYVRTSTGQTDLTVACRLGFWGSTVTGTAWFDDIKVEKITGDVSRFPIQYVSNPPSRKINFQRSWSYWLGMGIILMVILTLWKYLSLISR